MDWARGFSLPAGLRALLGAFQAKPRVPTSSISDKACDSYCFASGLDASEGYRYSNQEERSCLCALIDEHFLLRTTRDHLNSYIITFSTVQGC